MRIAKRNGAAVSVGYLTKPPFWEIQNVSCTVASELEDIQTRGAFLRSLRRSNLTTCMWVGLSPPGSSEWVLVLSSRKRRDTTRRAVITFVRGVVLGIVMNFNKNNTHTSQVGRGLSFRSILSSRTEERSLQLFTP